MKFTVALHNSLMLLHKTPMRHFPWSTLHNDEIHTCEHLHLGISCLFFVIIPQCCWSICVLYPNIYETIQLIMMLYILCIFQRCYSGKFIHPISWTECAGCRNHNPVLFTFITYKRICNTGNTTGATTGAWTTILLEQLNSHTVSVGFVLIKW